MEFDERTPLLLQRPSSGTLAPKSPPFTQIAETNLDFGSYNPHTLTGRFPQDQSDVATQTEANDAPPVDEHSLSVKEVTYAVKETIGPWYKGACMREKRNRTVLIDINMHIVSGQITAVLGNSGSGKTSLLDVIACRTPSSSEINGNIYFNHSRVTKELMQEQAGYVMQADRHLPNLTVRECLFYIARLKFAANIPGFSIRQQVIRVIGEMGLRHVANSKVGSSMNRGISGGEKRRVTIAAQLLQDPKILMLDEPTSGLDSFTAHHLIENLARLARKNKIILLTIHQPRSDIFRLFDQIAILSMGMTVYFGPAKEMVPYFSYIGYPCPKNANPLDHYVDLASIDRRDHGKRRNTIMQVSDLVSHYKLSSLSQSYISKMENILLQDSTDDEENIDTSETVLGTYALTFSRRTPGWTRKTSLLVRRLMVNLYRDRPAFLMRSFQLAAFALFLIMFLGHLKKNIYSIQDRTGLMYETVQVPPYIGLLNSIYLFPSLRDLYYRESRDGLYSGSSFVISYFIHITPFNLLVSTIFSTLVYWVVGLNPEPSRFGIYLSVVFILTTSGDLMAVLALAIFENPRVATSCVSLIFTASGLIASGFIKTIDSMIEPFKVISWATLHKYCSEIVVANEYEGLKFDCNDFSCPIGDWYLKTFYPDATNNMTRDFLCLSGMTLSLAFIAILAFKIKGTPNMN